jgi:hypothetical protein
MVHLTRTCLISKAYKIPRPDQKSPYIFHAIKFVTKKLNAFQAVIFWTARQIGDTNTYTYL